MLPFHWNVSGLAYILQSLSCWTMQDWSHPYEECRLNAFVISLERLAEAAGVKNKDDYMCCNWREEVLDVFWSFQKKRCSRKDFLTLNDKLEGRKWNTKKAMGKGLWECFRQAIYKGWLISAGKRFRKKVKDTTSNKIGSEREVTCVNVTCQLLGTFIGVV